MKAESVELCDSDANFSANNLTHLTINTLNEALARKRKRRVSINLILINIILLLCLILIPLSNFLADAAYAQGNLFVVYDAPIGRTSDGRPLRTNLSDLWCQATTDGQTRLGLKNSRFLQVVPTPPRVFRGFIYANRSHLHFSEVQGYERGIPPSVAGKYKCEMTTIDEEFVTGNLFVYMRPIFKVDSNLRFDQDDDLNPFTFTASSVKVTRGDSAILHCPAIGYPIPQITWYKDGELIDVSNGTKYKHLNGGNLQIFEVDDADEGIYRCIATNQFPLKVDVAEHKFSAQMEQHLRVASSWAWVIPLIIIAVILILLFIIIYSCAWWKRYKHKQYNVERKEKCLRKAEKQHLEENNVEHIEDDDFDEE